jgi:hypothetical protein
MCDALITFDMSKRRAKEACVAAKRSKISTPELSFRRWVLVYLCVALQCDTPILESIRHAMLLRLGGYVEAVTARLLAWSWRVTRDLDCSQIWRCGEQQIALTRVDTRHHQELHLTRRQPDQFARLCLVGSVWFIGDRHHAKALRDASLPAVLQWLEAHL